MAVLRSVGLKSTPDVRIHGTRTGHGHVVHRDALGDRSDASDETTQLTVFPYTASALGADPYLTVDRDRGVGNRTVVGVCGDAAVRHD